MDRPIRIATRGEAHAKGLLHRCVHIFMFRDSEHGELLIQQRSKKKKVSPLKWCHSASGHLLAGQSYLAGAIHELDELFHESEVPFEVISNLRKFANFRMTDSPTNNEFVALYMVVYDDTFERYDRNELACPPIYKRLDTIVQEVESNPDKYTLAFKQTLDVYMKLRNIYRINRVPIP
jgi:16S rRNA (adenine1518-N6/adenine1519-N6)-dimethyltransferase